MHCTFLTKEEDVAVHPFSFAPAAHAFLPITLPLLSHTGCLNAAISQSHLHPRALYQAKLFPSSDHFCVSELHFKAGE